MASRRAGGLTVVAPFCQGYSVQCMAATPRSRFHIDGFLCPCRASSSRFRLPAIRNMSCCERSNGVQQVPAKWTGFAGADQETQKSSHALCSSLERNTGRRPKSSAELLIDCEEARRSGLCWSGCCGRASHRLGRGQAESAGSVKVRKYPLGSCSPSSRAPHSRTSGPHAGVV
jgi:hypothetical protein